MTGRRRSHGEGGVYQRESDGRWVGAVDLGWIDGKRRRRVVYGRTEREVLGKLRDMRRASERGQDLSARPRTVAEWLAEWMAEVKAHDGTRTTTLRRYQQIVDGHLVPVLGKVRLDHLAPRDVQRLLSERRESVSAATLVKIHGVLRVALADAERMELVPRNVARAVRPPSLTREERRALTVSEAQRFLKVLTGHRLEAVFVVALTMGLRRGEVLGLKWDDIDVDGRTLWVRRAVQRVGGELRFVEPKTHRSRRSLPIPSSAVAVLERHRARQAVDRLSVGEVWRDYGLVFTTSIGTPLEPRNVNRAFDQLREAAGLSWLRLHDLRHACATFLLAEGIEPRTVMEVLGHSTIRLTMDTYGHALPERMHAAADALDRLLSS